MAAPMRACFWKQFCQFGAKKATHSKAAALIRCIHTQSVLCDKSNAAKALTTTNADDASTRGKVLRINKAMEGYLKSMDEHDQNMAEHEAEFEMGKRYLANMMGADPENFTQEEIDEAIEYLMPSGLHSRRARPMMKRPSEIFPKRKAAEFDANGRPFHYLFYTGKPNYYELLHTIGIKIGALDKVAQKDTSELDSKTTILANINILDGRQWIDKDVLKSMLLEEVSNLMYDRFITLLSRLANHARCYTEKEFILQYTVPIAADAVLAFIPAVITDEQSGERHVIAQGKRRTSKAEVKIWEKGDGKFVINNKGVDYFKNLTQREQLLTPLTFTNRLGKVDIEGMVEGGGEAGQAGALRLAISLGLAAFEDEKFQENMRQAGLLTRDPRTMERQKPGQRGAREKKTWKRR